MSVGLYGEFRTVNGLYDDTIILCKYHVYTYTSDSNNLYTFKTVLEQDDYCKFSNLCHWKLASTRNGDIAPL